MRFFTIPLYLVYFDRFQNSFSNMSYIFNRTLYRTSVFSLSKLFINLPSIYTETLNAFLNSVRTYSYCKYKYSIEVETALNKQIKSEHNAAFTYISMAVNFLHPSISYPGVGGYFMKMYEEELDHMKVLVNYQIIRGGTPSFKFDSVNLVINQSTTLVAAFAQALETEKQITEQLENFVKSAEAQEDYRTVDFITSKFLSEQIHAINELSQYISILNRLGDDPDALYQFDSNFSKLYPYSLKI